jgi:CheY-like chemotaxis protein
MAAQSFAPDIVLRTTIASEVDGVLVDPVQFEAALLNLCTNARDAMPAGGTIELAARVETLAAARDGLARGRYVVISVTDAGTGMDRATQRKALEPYFSTKGDKGAGLGLSSAQGFARQSGGDLTVISALGQGTTVELWLQPAMVRTEPHASVMSGTAVGPLTVLVVDDDPLVGLSTTSLLADIGHSVVEAGSGRDALAVLAARHVDFVITDYRMPGMSGVALAREVRRRWPSIPVVIYTGFADVSEQERGGFPFISKPASAGEFAHVIAQLTGRRGDRPDGPILRDLAG